VNYFIFIYDACSISSVPHTNKIWASHSRRDHPHAAAAIIF
jgi:hypothetical protein